MNIREELLKEHSKTQTNRNTNYIGENHKKFAELMGLFFNDENRVVQRASWCVSNCAVTHPELVLPYLKKMIELLNKNVHNAVKRNIVRTLQFIEIPRKYYGIATQACFDLLISKNEPVAVKVFSMTVLANISKNIPDIKNELRIIIYDQLPYASAGFKSRARKILMAIEN